MIADILPRYQVTSDGSTVVYTVPFELIESNLINVYVDSKKQSSGYSVNVSAKTITFDNAPDEGKLITIIRAIPISWEVSDFGSLNEESLNNALTLLIAKMQTLEEEISRSPKTNPYDKETGSDLSELFFTEMRDALDSLEQAKVVYAQIQASGTQALVDITTEKNSAISDINDNSSDRIGEFNTNATNKTTAFNINANTVTDTFNQNATDKTDDFNTNAAQKQATVDASATAAAISEANAATSEANAATSEANAASTEARINETLSTYVTYVGDPTGEVTLKNKDDQTLIPYTELATANKAGRIKPDGTTTSVDSNGAMSVVGKQDTLVSGTNIKTVNGNSLLGSGDMTIGAQVSWGNVTGTLSNQTDLQTALNAKQATITGAASTITSSNLTANMALRTDDNGKITNSSATSTELSYLSGVTSNIQTQLNAKANDSDVIHKTGNETIDDMKTFTTSPREVSNINDTAWNMKNTADDYTTIPETQQQRNFRVTDKNNKILSDFRQISMTNGKRYASILIRNAVSGEEKQSAIIVQVDANGTISATCPSVRTQTQGDIVTWNDMQVVSALPSSPVSGVFYFVKE